MPGRSVSVVSRGAVDKIDQDVGKVRCRVPDLTFGASLRRIKDLDGWREAV